MINRSALLLVLSLCALCYAEAAEVENDSVRKTETPWTATWAAAQQIPGAVNAFPQADLDDATLRQIVHVSTGGARLRVRFSNLFGSGPLVVDAAHVANASSPGSSATKPGSDRVLSFDGQPGTTIPAGGERASDPVEFPVVPSADLAITIHLAGGSRPDSGHSVSSATSYYVKGDKTASIDMPRAAKVDHWYFLAGVDVAGASGDRGVIVMLGDSITDGVRSTPNGNDRWPDALARRLQAQAGTPGLGVANVGIAGNCILEACVGPSAIARFDRDVISQPGARWVIILEGINDIGRLTARHQVDPSSHRALVDAIIDAEQRMIDRAHARGLRAIGGTILPDGGSLSYHPDAQSNADRRAVNAWIRAPGHFDGVVDFAAALRDPSNPNRLQPRYDSGDHLHPSPEGYRAMAAAVPLELFTSPER